jgi:hypothetical protein
MIDDENCGWVVLFIVDDCLFFECCEINLEENENSIVSVEREKKT